MGLQCDFNPYLWILEKIQKPGTHVRVISGKKSKPNAEKSILGTRLIVFYWKNPSLFFSFFICLEPA